MNETLRTIDTLTDVQAVAAIRQLNRRVFANVPFATVQAASTATGLKSVPDSLAAVRLDPATSTELSRTLLRAFAGDPTLDPLVTDVIDTVRKDDSLFIEAAIAVGLLVNLTMFMSSSEMTFKTGKLTITKGRVDSDLVKTILEPVTALIKKLPGTS